MSFLVSDAFDSIGRVMMNSIDPGEQVKNALIGLARDIRGLAYSFNQKTPYMMFFDWIYPTYSPILIRAVEIWAHDPSVTTPVLKFFGELVQNRSQRLVFDVSSPNGYLLFRETSKLICCYGNRILSIDVPKDQIYQMRFKGISVCFLMLKAILCGNYVNLGVFKLYGDNAFDSVMNTAAKLILSIPHKDLLVSDPRPTAQISSDDAFAFSGISEAQRGLLHSPRMPSSGSHKILVNTGADSLSLHSRKHFRRAECVG
jgi:exportin-7